RSQAKRSLPPTSRPMVQTLTPSPGPGPRGGGPLLHDSGALGSPAPPVDQHGDHDDGADDHLLPVGVDHEQVEAVADDPHDEGADERAQDAALAAGKAGAADDHRG